MALLFSLLMLLSTAPACAQAPADEALTPENTIYIPSAGSAGRIPVEELISCAVGSPDRVEDVLGYEHIVIDAACLGGGADAVLRAASERCADILILGDISENSVRQHFGMEPVERADLPSSPLPAPEESAADGSRTVDLSAAPSVGKLLCHGLRGTVVVDVFVQEPEKARQLTDMLHHVFSYDYSELVIGSSAEEAGAAWPLAGAACSACVTERCVIDVSLRLYRNPGDPLPNGQRAFYALYRSEAACLGAYRLSGLTVTVGGSGAAVLDYTPYEQSAYSPGVTVGCPWGTSASLNGAMYVGTERVAGGINSSGVAVAYRPLLRQSALSGAAGVEAVQDGAALSGYGRCTVAVFGPGTTSLTDSVHYTTGTLLAGGR